MVHHFSDQHKGGKKMVTFKNVLLGSIFSHHHRCIITIIKEVDRVINRLKAQTTKAKNTAVV